MKKYSDDELLEQMRKFYEKNNRITQRSFTKDKTVCSASSIIYRFGSWENAMEKAGITWKEYVDDIETKREKVRKMVKELEAISEKPVTVVATGGLASLIELGIDCIHHVDKMLTLEGLEMIYEKNRKPNGAHKDDIKWQ